MNLTDLNQRFAIPGQLEFVTGDGDLTFIEISNTAADCRLSLYGGQVLSYRPKGAQRDLLFLSAQAYYEQGKSIKGGVPLCWPWFGADPEGRGRPAHGFARNSLWSVAHTERVANDCTRVTLSLCDDPASRALWPHRFDLRLVVTVGDTLDLQLVTRNTGDDSMQLTQALHTYFAVGDIDAVRVEGLDGLDYLDKVQGFARCTQSGAVTFDREVDRIYLGVSGPLRIDDASDGSRIEIAAHNSATAVVWNPWQAISRAMADLGDDDYRAFACVETANAADEVVTLPPGAEYALGATYRLHTKN